MVKIEFENAEELQRAIDESILLECCSVCVRVERSEFRPRVIQCFNCHKFGHIAANCVEEPICVNCGDKNHAPPCMKEPRCLNCNGTHPSYESVRYSASCKKT